MDFSKAGLPIAEFCLEKSLDKHLIGGFFSVIKSYSQYISDKGLKSFEMENNKFIIESILQGNAFLVCRSISNVSDKKLEKMCKIIIKIFEEMYEADDIINWNGNIFFFNKFKDRLDLYFKVGNL